MIPLVTRRTRPCAAFRALPLFGALFGIHCSTSSSPFPQRASAEGGAAIVVEPSDDGDALYDSMSRARRSIHVSMYLLTSARFTDLLIAKSRAGIDVRVVLNKTFPPESTTNALSHRKLAAAGVPVAWAPSVFTYSHEKCVIVDGTAAWIMTMNLDESALRDNREFLAVDTRPDDVADAEALFLADESGSSLETVGDLVVAPDNALPRLLALVDSATRTLDVEDEEFSDPAITAAIATIAARGVIVRVVLSTESQSSSEVSAVSRLRSSGARVVRTAAPFIHAKAVVADGARVFVGSENLTSSSLKKNRELGLITEAAKAVGAVEAAIDQDYSNGTPE